MLRMPLLISRHSQFLWAWQLVAAGASTAGFLEKVAADLERELRTFKYPAMFRQKSLSGSTLDETQSKEGAKCTRAFCNIPSGSTAPLPAPAGDAGLTSEVTTIQRSGGRLAWPFTSFCTSLMNNYWETFDSSATKWWWCNNCVSGAVCRKPTNVPSNHVAVLRKVGRVNTVIWGEHLKSLLATVYAWVKGFLSLQHWCCHF